MPKTEELKDGPLGLRVGEVVQVRSESEILATLDERGELDSLPFMPEMVRFCGRRFKVDKLAVKLCDTINWSGIYRMKDAVHLAGLRCDGEAHGGCQAGCLLYWKEAWLRRVDDNDEEPVADIPPQPMNGSGKPTLIATLSQVAASAASGEVIYSCQATELMRAAPEYIPFWNVRQYVVDVRSGNVGAPAAIRSISIGLFNKYQGFSRRFLPRWLRIKEGRRFPFTINGKLRKTPQEILNLQPGELVRIKSVEEIAKTLDTTNRNRGMTFDAEMVKYCGRRARVLRRAEKIIDEKTGKMQHLANPCIILEDVICTSDFHRLCPRGIYPYWREIWLERVEEPRASAGDAATRALTGYRNADSSTSRLA
jgi:hypothetical protein